MSVCFYFIPGINNVNNAIKFIINTKFKDELYLTTILLMALEGVINLLIGIEQTIPISINNLL